MRDIEDQYRVEEGTRLIEISLKTVHQLFNSFDPSPFHEKDLDDDAEEYIVDAVREFSISTPLKLVFYLPGPEMADTQTIDLAKSIHRYFEYRAAAARSNLRFLFRQGRQSLLAGLMFLALCLTLRALVFTPSGGTFDLIAGEGLIIIGWVAMWKPLEIFLYDWWPIRRRVLVFDKLAVIPVEPRPHPDPSAPGGGPAGADRSVRTP